MFPPAVPAGGQWAGGTPSISCSLGWDCFGPSSLSERFHSENCFTVPYNSFGTLLSLSMCLCGGAKQGVLGGRGWQGLSSCVGPAPAWALCEQNQANSELASTGRPLTLFCKAPRGTWGLKGNSLSEHLHLCSFYKAHCVCLQGF